MDKTSILLLLTVVNSVLISTVRANSATSNGYRRPMCNENMLWAPMFTDRPYITLLNSAFCPSWTTKNLITKDSLNKHIYLPYGIPFSFMCGACYTGTTTLNKMLTLQRGVNSDAASPYDLNQVAIKTREGSPEFTENGHKCMVQYGITPPLKHDGSLICKAQLGKFYSEESATFSVVKMTIVRSNETLDVRTDTVSLSCPEHPTIKPHNLLTHVWYLPNAPGTKMAASTNNPRVKFRVLTSRPLVVACATFHLLSESAVMETTYTVRKISTGSFRSQSPSSGSDLHSDSGFGGPGKPADSYQVYGEDEVGASVSTAGGSLNIVIIIVLSATAVVLLIIALISLPKCIKARRGR